MTSDHFTLNITLLICPKVLTVPSRRKVKDYSQFKEVIREEATYLSYKRI
jgi:hypothetical protein